MRKLRAFFRGEPGATRLHLDVTPAANLSIAIDGRLVGSSSPFASDDIAPGTHKLSVAAADHYAFTVPIEVHDGTPLKLRIALRRVPPDPPRHKVTQPREPRPRVQEATPPQRLPAGIAPIQLTIAGEPSTTAVLDGEPLTVKTLRIEYVTGDFGMGRARLGYRVGGAGLLELRIPDDGAQWFRDGEPLDDEARFAFYRGKTRLQQIQPNGDTQTIYLAR